MERVLIHDFVPEFLDDGVRQDFAGHALNLLFGGVAGNAVEVKHKKFSLAHILNLAKPQRGKGVLNRLTLWIEDGALRHDPNVSFHRGHYTKLSAATPE